MVISTLPESGIRRYRVASSSGTALDLNGEVRLANAALGLLDGFAVWLGRVRAQLGRPS
jgi:hypothetical protein